MILGKEEYIEKKNDGLSNLEETIKPNTFLSTFFLLQWALYDTGYGYYGSGRAKIGRHGDFFTNVSIGNLYGQLLAHYFYQMWKKLGRPKIFQIAEQGAFDGQLAADILQAAPQINKDYAAAIQYHIIEPNPIYKQSQQKQLSSFLNIHWEEDLCSFQKSHLTGIFFSNELLDAFPVYQITLHNGTWHEMGFYYTADPEKKWHHALVPITSPELKNEISKLPKDLPEGYTTEISLQAFQWVRDASQCLKKGLILIMDYGLPAGELYAPHRTEGTLRGYRKHKQIQNLLSHLGETDWTTHINLTRLIEVGIENNLQLEQLSDQHHFLTKVATPWLQSLEGNIPDANTQKKLRQFRSLTHPTLMGKNFHALALRTYP